MKKMPYKQEGRQNKQAKFIGEYKKRKEKSNGKKSSKVNFQLIKSKLFGRKR